MVGVICGANDRRAAQEFFELFKTPWELYESGKSYEVLIVDREEEVPSIPVKLLIQYSSAKTQINVQRSIGHEQRGHTLSYKGRRIPIYGDCVTFSETQGTFLTDEDTKGSAGYKSVANGETYCRIGYDLFREIQSLLTVGQPPENATIPTIELHIALLRDLIIGSGVRLVEIPPFPIGHAFIACLTHDVDHPSIRLHKWDHTLFGFLYRAIVRSLSQVFRGRMPIRHLFSNYVAVAKVPLIHLGLAKDFWYDFDKYLQLEDGASSTFFALPFKGSPGMTTAGLAPQMRASSYGAADIAERLRALVSSRQEVGLHGIDAWIDSARGEDEMAQIATTAGVTNIGVRMHWLYFNEHSPLALEKAGFSYDSTVGYNQTIGYRAGTSQVYRPLDVTHLLELPLHIMDTALFYPNYLNLTFREADRRIGSIVDCARQFGGAVTLNWHDRSRAPERLWGEFYGAQIRGLKQKGAWCANARDTVAWFRNRRSVVFERANRDGTGIRIRSESGFLKNIPGLRLRVYNAKDISDDTAGRYSDSAITTTSTILQD